MKNTREQVKEEVQKLINKGYSLEDAFAHPDIGEDMLRVIYADAGHDFDSCDWEMDFDEMLEKAEKVEAEIRAMFEA